jgi:superfamily I DNA/RNA helicase
MIRKVLGPPGTGKTTTLLNYVKNYLNQGIAPSRIGYFAFTKKAASHAKEEMIKRYPDMKKSDLRYFQTLHSFAFHTLGLSEDRVMQPVHYEQIGEQLSIRVVFDSNKEENFYLNCDNEYFKLITKAQVKNISVMDEFNSNQWSRKINKDILLQINMQLEYFKKQNDLVDYTDMIKDFLKEENSKKSPEFEAVFIDEAQDLSPVQWQMYDILKSKSKDIYLAGDDDQAIFAWAGADVNRFIYEEAEEQVLDQSSRVPRKIQELSEIIIDRIRGPRKIKKYFPKRDSVTKEIVEGSVQRINNIDQINLFKDKWLILTRTTHRAVEIAAQLKERNVYFKYLRKPFFGKSYDKKLYKSVLNWTRLCKGEQVNISDCKDIYDYLNIDYDESRFKNKVEVVMEDLGFKRTLTWFEAFTNANQSESLYIRNMLANGEKLSEEPNIEISTIHAAKGGECENVVLVLDNARQIRNALSLNMEKLDEEHRVWYVGTTRCANNLYLLSAKKERYGYQL